MIEVCIALIIALVVSETLSLAPTTANGLIDSIMKRFRPPETIP